MECKNCGNELQEGQKFCGKCGQKVDEEVILPKNEEVTNNVENENYEKNTDSTESRKKNNKNLIMAIAIVIIIVIGIIIGVVIYKNTVITEQYITEKFLENGFSQYDKFEVEILDIEDINYNDFNKLVFAEINVTNNGESASLTGFLLVNKKEDEVQSFSISNNIIFILNGVAKNQKSLAKEITKVTAEKIETLGTDVFDDVATEELKDIMNSYANIIGLEESRKYVKEGFEQTNSGTLDTTLLFEKGSPMIKYMAFYMTTTKYNTSYPIDENMYQYFSRDYSYRDTLNALQYAYGPAYVTVKEYQVYKMGEFSNETEFQNLLVGTYSSIDKAKQDLNVDE